jgi:hypothetical protein
MDNSATCKTAGCGRIEPLVKGLCQRCYTRMRRHGDVTATAKPTYDTVEQMFRHYMPDGPPDGKACWLWRGTIADTGYGTFFHKGRRYGAHRVAYELFNGPIPAGQGIRHQCVGNRSCVNPAHLLTGTQAQNVADTVRQGRTPVGERNGQATLSKADMQRLRRAYERGNVSQTELGRQFGISQAQVSRIVTGRRWSKG